MANKKKAKTKINPILSAAIEDAFDNCKTPDEMSELTKNIVEKMSSMYWTKKNSQEDGQEDD